MIDQTKRLDGGLHKLIEAAEHLSELNEKLQVQKTHVDEQTLVPLLPYPLLLLYIAHIFYFGIDLCQFAEHYWPKQRESGGIPGSRH